MADLSFVVDWDITPAEQKQNKLQREFEESQAKLQHLANEHKKTLDLIEQEKAKQAEITNEIKEQSLVARELEKTQEKLIQKFGSDYIGVEQIQKEIDTVNANAEKLTQAREQSYATQQKLESSAARETLELQKQENKTRTAAENIAIEANRQREVAEQAEKTNENIQESADSASAAAGVTEKMGDAAKHATLSFEKFTKRIIGLAKRVFIFSLITKALRALRKAISEKISSDSGLAKYLSEIKGNLAVMGQTAYEAAKPIIEWFLQKLAYLTQLLSVILARVLKKDVNQMKEFAKQSNKAAKAAEKTTASWDTLQQIKSSESETESGTNAEFGQFDMAKWTDEQLTKIEALAAGALIALGIILCCAGVSIPLGLALIAAGAALLVREVIPNWNTLSDETKRQIAKITAIASAAMLALGIILLVATGFNPLAIGLIVMGAIGLATSAVIMLNTLPDEVKSGLGKVMAIVGAAMLAIGVILCVTGNVPLGVALIALGAASLVSAVVANKDKIIEWVQHTADTIKGIFDWLFDKIWDKFGDKITNAQHAIADFLNRIINAVNNLLARILNTGWASALFNAIGVDTSNWRIPPVSYLAQGAAIPGGKPFMAVMGDQPRGQTNLEAPEPLIRQIVREESASNINIKFSGSLAQLARILKPEIERETTRATMY